jgi:hypothetical protein
MTRNSRLQQGTEFQVNAYTSGAQDEVSVCCDGPGGFVVQWTSQNQDGSGTGIFGQIFDDSGAAEGTNFQTNTYTPGNQQDSDVCCDALGNFVVAWETYGQDGEESGIFSRSFNSDGTPRGGESQVNTYTPDDQLDPAVSCGDDGRCLIIWTDDTQDGDNFGIFGQFFGTPASAAMAPLVSWMGLAALAALLVGAGSVRLRRRQRR